MKNILIALSLLFATPALAGDPLVELMADATGITPPPPEPPLVSAVEGIPLQQATWQMIFETNAYNARPWQPQMFVTHY